MANDPFDNLIPLYKTKPLKPRAQYLLDSVKWAGDVVPILERDYLVKGWLDRGGVSVLYGPSNTGKSFLALDLVHHIAKGRMWGGRRVKRGRVLYVAAEGGAGFNNRVAALDSPEFFVMVSPLLLTGKDSHGPALIDVMRHLSEVGKSAFDMIVFDTMSRVMGGADENAAPDIADLMRNIGGLQRASGAHIMLVHHTGKDVGRGARGHSSLRAAVDTEIELTRDDLGLISAQVTKQREGPTGHKFDFTLRQVELGEDQDGDQITTCVVEPADRRETGRNGLSESSRVALDVLIQTIADSGEQLHKPNYPGTPCVSLDAWRDGCGSGSKLTSSDNRETQMRAFRRAREELVSAKIVLVRDDLTWVIA